MKSLLGKLSNIQSKIVVSKDGTNPHFKSKYLTLETIVNTVDPLLRSNGLVVTNYSKNGVLVTSIKEIESGDSIESEFPLLNTNKPQEVGSAFTYARRYNLCNLLNIVADRDDDGEAAEGRGATAKTNTGTTEKNTGVSSSVSLESSMAKEVTKGPEPKKVSFSKKAFVKVNSAPAGDDL